MEQEISDICVDNIKSSLGHLLAEFTFFLKLILYDEKSNSMIRNALVVCRRIYIRELCCFFRTTREQDDLIYTDFIEYSSDVSIDIPDNVRKYINKCTMHMSKLRTKFDSPSKNEFVDIVIRIIKSITIFMREIGERKIKQKYIDDLNDKVVNDLIMVVNCLLISINILNAKNLEELI